VAADHGRGMALYRRACALQEPQACHNISVNLRRATPPDMAQALVYMEKACANGRPRDCLDLAQNYRFGQEGAARDIQKALIYYDRTCHSPTSDPAGAREEGCEDGLAFRHFCLGNNPAKFCFGAR